MNDGSLLGRLDDRKLKEIRFSPCEGCMSDTDHAFRALLETGEVVPAFTLPGADGMPYGPWMYKQREHLLMLIILSTANSETRGLLKAFAREYRSFREEECAVLVISTDTVVGNLQAQKELQASFPLLADPKGEVIGKYTEWDAEKRVVMPSIVLVDRYGALFRQWVEEKEEELVGIEEILETLRYLNRMCRP
jgi:peroxiredoxin